MLDINKNLETLFDTREFYKIIADKNGRTVLYGQLNSGGKTHVEESLKAALEYTIEVRKASEDNDPILIYPDFRDTTELPMYALDDEGEYHTFEKGYYLRPLDKPALKEILMSYTNQKVEPKELEDCINYGLDWFDETFNNIRAFVGRQFYLISGCMIDGYTPEGKYHRAEGLCIEKYDSDMIKSLEIETKLSNYPSIDTTELKKAIRLIMQDKQATGNNHPIVVFNGKDSTSYVIDSEVVKILEPGYYLPVHYEPIYDMDAVIEHIYDAEMSNFITPGRSSGGFGPKGR
jgi:hypothetical protein